ncbi:MAG: UDP-N-acetylmuramoyl-L-alanyl-D-glutamate--2,6-diaminopimelate ligase [Anaerolineales bacterium]|nr:UDP-N-acetylmuramoyl-L-alanyl-D-glutamate--2,6-diaminopimelate ligase [Anaerolineales bacterium]
MALEETENETRSLLWLLQEWQTAVSPHHPQPPHYTGPGVTLYKFVEDSRQAEPGAAFVARVRVGSDGHPYIGQAVARGASLVIAQRPLTDFNLTLPDNVGYLHVPDTAEALAWLAAAWHDFPSRTMTVIGITGTDGKTSTANILYEILRAAGIKAGLLSTVRAVVGATEEPLALHVTTPEAPVVQAYLRRMVNAGLTHCILESTSHGLAQQRVGAIEFDVAAVTNITHEHLDYHGSYEAYFAAKARLFEALTAAWSVKEMGGKTAVLNRDDQAYEQLAVMPVPHQISYGLYRPADITATNIHYAAAATRFNLHLPHHEPLPVASHLLGEFNVYNMLAAAGVAQSLAVPAEAIVEGLGAVAGINGRMERIDAGQPFLVVVDFAHTPNSLEKVIGVARAMLPEGKNGRVITVFGSAGKRDVAKRRLMAAASARHADLTILTAEDPRTESLADILAMMAAACEAEGGCEGETFWRVPDRGRAIYFALTLAQPDDIVLVCGKGHEQSMCFGTVEHPWDDRHATRTALTAWLRGEPMPDLGLPTFV